MRPAAVIDVYCIPDASCDCGGCIPDVSCSCGGCISDAFCRCYGYGYVMIRNEVVVDVHLKGPVLRLW